MGAAVGLPNRASALLDKPNSVRDLVALWWARRAVGKGTTKWLYLGTRRMRYLVSKAAPFVRIDQRRRNRASCGRLTPRHAMFCFFLARRAASKAMRRSRSARIGAISSNVEAPLATRPRRLKAYLLGFAPVCRYISSTPITAT